MARSKALLEIVEYIQLSSLATGEGTLTTSGMVTIRSANGGYRGASGMLVFSSGTSRNGNSGSLNIGSGTSTAGRGGLLL